MFLLIKFSILICLLNSAYSKHEDDVVEDFGRLMHESSEDVLSGYSEAEIQKKLRLILEDVDTDDDNVIEFEELDDWIEMAEKKVTKADAIKELDSMDSDDDDAVSWSEYEKSSSDDSAEELKFAKRLFDIADEDDDGELNLEEYIRFSNPEDDDNMRPLLIEKLLKTLDKDGDNKLSYAEVKKIAKNYKIFDEDDENDDGFLDREELDDILDDDYEEEELGELLKILKTADDDRDGKLEIEELVEEEHLFRDTPIFTYGMKLLNMKEKGKDEL